MRSAGGRGRPTLATLLAKLAALIVLVASSESSESTAAAQQCDAGAPLSAQMKARCSTPKEFDRVVNARHSVSGAVQPLPPAAPRRTTRALPSLGRGWGFTGYGVPSIYANEHVADFTQQGQVLIGDLLQVHGPAPPDRPRVADGAPPSAGDRCARACPAAAARPPAVPQGDGIG